MCDIDTHKWDHRVCSLSACQDMEESADTGHGGLLTICIKKAMVALATQGIKPGYPIASVFQLIQKYAGTICDEQRVEMMHANLDPALHPWPLAPLAGGAGKFCV